MNAELEAILRSYQAIREAFASGAEAADLQAIYEARLDDVLQRHPNLSRETLQRMVDFAYGPWRRAQEKPSSMPPRA
jgi:hypothetical protein